MFRGRAAAALLILAASLVASVAFVPTRLVRQETLDLERARGTRVLWYVDAGHAAFDRHPLGGRADIWSNHDAHRPEDTMRFAVGPGWHELYVVPTPAPPAGEETRLRVRLRYPTLKGSNGAAGSAHSMIEARLGAELLHGPISPFRAMGDIVYTLRGTPAEATSVLALHDAAKGGGLVALAEAALERSALVVLRDESGRVTVRNEGDEEISYLLSRVDEAGVRRVEGPFAFGAGATNGPVEGAGAEVIELDEGPAASVSLADLASEPGREVGTFRFPDRDALELPAGIGDAETPVFVARGRVSPPGGLFVLYVTGEDGPPPVVTLSGAKVLAPEEAPAAAILDALAPRDVPAQLRLVLRREDAAKPIGFEIRLPGHGDAPRRLDRLVLRRLD
ncbi:MAG: hypothetical protein R3F20_17570 [Planctomycetota bacterium]